MDGTTPIQCSAFMSYYRSSNRVRYPKFGRQLLIAVSTTDCLCLIARSDVIEGFGSHWIDPPQHTITGKSWIGFDSAVLWSLTWDQAAPDSSTRSNLLLPIIEMKRWGCSIWSAGAELISDEQRRDLSERVLPCGRQLRHFLYENAQYQACAAWRALQSDPLDPQHQHQMRCKSHR